MKKIKIYFRFVFWEFSYIFIQSSYYKEDKNSLKIATTVQPPLSFPSSCNDFSCAEELKSYVCHNININCDCD